MPFRWCRLPGGVRSRVRLHRDPAGLPDDAVSVVPVAGRSEVPGQASPGPGWAVRRCCFGGAGCREERDAGSGFTGTGWAVRRCCFGGAGCREERDAGSGFTGTGLGCPTMLFRWCRLPGGVRSRVRLHRDCRLGCRVLPLPRTTTGTTDEPDPSLTRASGDTQPTGPGIAVTGVGKPAAAGSAWLPVPSRVVGTSSGETPTVTVHIGRVEVRNPPPPPPPPAPTPEPGPQPLSLEAYLDRRTGGSR